VLLHVPREMGSANTTTSLLLVVAEVAFRHIVSAFNDIDHTAVFVSKDRMAKQAVSVAMQISEDDGGGAVGAWTTGSRIRAAEQLDLVRDEVLFD
jgi:hypothetical protein